jgi:hypothetical protein
MRFRKQINENSPVMNKKVKTDVHPLKSCSTLKSTTSVAVHSAFLIQFKDFKVFKMILQQPPREYISRYANSSLLCKIKVILGLQEDIDENKDIHLFILHYLCELGVKIGILMRSSNLNFHARRVV